MVDLIYKNGRVYTVNGSQKWAQAFAVENGKFVNVGTNEEIESLGTDQTKVIDLEGKLVMPGLIDDHLHPDMAAENFFNVTVDAEATTWEEFKTSVSDYLEKNPDVKWVFGGNFDYLWDDGSDINMFGMPSHKSILDELIPDRPAYFWEVSGHAALINSKALEACGITKDTPDPPNGRYARDENGEPTGVVRAMGAHTVWEEYLKNRLPEKEIAYKQIKPIFQYLNSFGLTSVSDVWAREWYVKAYNILDRDDQLNMRMAVYVTDPSDWVTDWMKELANKVIENPKAYTSDNVSVLGVKFILDGAAAGRTVRLTEPYEGEEEFCGPWRVEPELFREKFLKYDQAALTVKVHAGGDAAIRLTLDTIEEARKQNNTTLRHSVAHTAILNPADINRFKELGAVAEFSPVFWYQMPAIDVIANDIGQERINWLYPVRSMIDTGANVSIGTDWTVTPVDPWQAIETVVTRRAPGVTEGPSLNAEVHGITLEEAVYLYTMGNSYAQYREDQTGSIEIGKYADFIVVDQDIFEIPVHKVHETKVLSTVVGGKEVYNISQAGDVIDFYGLTGKAGPEHS